MMRNQYVNMVACYLPRHYLQVMLHSNLANQVTHTHSHRPNQYLSTIFWNPNHVYFKIVFCVRTLPITSHATILHEFALRLKARGFHHPRWGH